MGNDLNLNFFEGFGGGTADQVDQGQYMPVSIAGRGYMIDTTTREYRRKAVDIYRNQPGTNQTDLTFLPPEIWRRSQESWHFGAGQIRLDREASQPYRFKSSHGVDVWEPWQATLLHTTTNLTLGTWVTGTNEGLMTVDHDTLFAFSDDKWWWWDDIDLAPSTGTAGSAIVDATTDGNALYTLHADGGVRKWTTGDGGAAYASAGANATMIQYVKGFLVVGAGNLLYDFNLPSDPRLIYQHPLDDHRWRSATEGLSVAYFLGGQGDKWLIYRSSIADDATELQPPAVAAQLPDGEIGNVIQAYLGYVLIGTDHGARFATPDASGNLTYGQLIETSQPVTSFEGQDRYVWFGVAGDGEIHPDECGGLGRMDLATFTAPNTPAYATDLCTGGVAGDVVSVVSIETTTVRSRRAFLQSGVGVYVEHATELIAGTGYIELSDLTYDVVEEKVGLYAQVSHDELSGSLTYSIAKDGGVFNDLVTNDVGGTTQFGNIPFQGERFTRLGQKVSFNRDLISSGAGPTLTRVESRAIPRSGTPSEWTLPLLINEHYDWMEAPIPRDPVRDLEWLLSLVQTGKPFVLREGTKEYACHAVDFDWRPERMTEDRSAWLGVFVLVARQYV